MINAAERAGKKTCIMHAIRTPLLSTTTPSSRPPLPIHVQSHSVTRPNLLPATDFFFLLFFFITAAAFRCLTRSVSVTHMALSEPSSVSLLSSPLPLAQPADPPPSFQINPITQNSLFVFAPKPTVRQSSLLLRDPLLFHPANPPPLPLLFYLSHTQRLRPTPTRSLRRRVGRQRPLHV